MFTIRTTKASISWPSRAKVRALALSLIPLLFDPVGATTSHEPVLKIAGDVVMYSREDAQLHLFDINAHHITSVRGDSLVMCLGAEART